MTEDNEMTLALKSLGAKMISPMQCRVVTEVMPTWRALWRQRMRWQRGALENIGAYGLTRATLRYWLQQLGIGYGTIALNAYLLLMLITLLAADGFEFVWFWFRSASSSSSSAWSRCGRPAGAGAIAFPLVIEIAYDLVLQAVFVKSLVDIATGRAAGWNYVPREAAAVASHHDILSDSSSPRRCCGRLVPGPGHLRRHQHARLRRAEPRQAHPAARA